MRGFQSQPDIANAAVRRRTADFCGASQTEGSLWLAAETIVVTVSTLAVVRSLNSQHFSDLTWLAIPSLLVIAALLPLWLRHGTFPPVSWGRGQWAGSLAAVCHASLWTFPPVFFGLWLVTRLGGSVPLAAATGRDNCLSWLIYQFLYVAVAEEVFFRGYVQTNVTRLLGRMSLGSRQTSLLAGALVSAGCFAMAHVAIQGRVTSLLTFLPGLVLAWLFIRTQSLLAPILYHGLANVAYTVMATMLL